MTNFQALTIATLTGLLAWELARFVQGKARLRFWLLRCLAWSTAAVAIAYPDAVTWVAQTLGIRRGADLVVYLLALSFLGAVFFLYSRHVKLQGDITLLVRRLALMEAARGGQESEASEAQRQ